MQALSETATFKRTSCLAAAFASVVTSATLLGTVVAGFDPQGAEAAAQVVQATLRGALYPVPAAATRVVGVLVVEHSVVNPAP